MLDKQQLRTFIKKQRLALNENEVKAKSFSCLTQLKNIDLKDYKSIGIYLSIRNELDTKAIIEYLWQNDKDVYIPKCENEGIMNFYKINTFEDVSTGKFGISEPKVLENKQNQLDLLIIPLVACNEDGYRLGMGGGYYDRFISKYPTYTLGIAYQFQYIDFIPESHDLRFDLLITDKKIYRFGN